MTLALLLAFAPTVRGLRLVTPDRIVVMEPGEQHQARHPASANWALGFPDQFQFAAASARSSVSVTSPARIVEHSFHAMM